MDRFILSSQPRPVQYSTFRQIAHLTQLLRNASGNQRIDNFYDDELTGAELEQGGQLDLSFEEEDIDNMILDGNENNFSTTNVTNSTSHEPYDSNIDAAELGFNNQNTYEGLSRRAGPLIKQQKQKYECDSAEQFQNQSLNSNNSNSSNEESPRNRTSYSSNNVTNALNNFSSPLYVQAIGKAHGHAQQQQKQNNQQKPLIGKSSSHSMPITRQNSPINFNQFIQQQPSDLISNDEYSLEQDPNRASKIKKQNSEYISQFEEEEKCDTDSTVTTQTYQQFDYLLDNEQSQ
eukprot:403332134